jgi:Ca2+-binding RTX toxin-like protein
MIEPLENRTLFTAVLNPATGLLTVNGLPGAAADLIQVSQTPSAIIVRHSNHAGEIQSFPVTRVRRLLINGFAGNDLLRLDANVTKPATINGHDGNDAMFGGAAGDRLLGGNGDDWHVGQGGNDVMDGGLGADELVGSAGIDTVTYAARLVGVRVTIDNVANDGQGAEGDNVRGDVENLIGGRGNDSLTGSNAANQIFGGPGNDRIVGLGGADRMFGNDGNDHFFPADGVADFVDGGPGNDNVPSSDAVDVIVNVP